ncbi:MAG: DUF4397 domain-containing protein [Bradymonadaceae bacterium]|nr:DUF4397 domain-containing protein [Lujinxingiaceae bacterium]
MDCRTDDECLGHQQCTSNFECVTRTSCSGNDQCAAGRVCISSACVAKQCDATNSCPIGSECQEGACIELPRQCTAVGQNCDLNRLERPGFACHDMGAGPKCYEACVLGSSAGNAVSYTCTPGSICIDRKACRPSECAGVLNGQATCDQIAQADPSKFPNGSTCSRETDAYRNYANLCVPAGTRQLGDECARAQPCKSGLVCVSRIPILDLSQTSTFKTFCAEPCNANTPCSKSDEGCIGDDINLFQGAGICGDRCNPYNIDEQNCADDKSCLPISNTDGMCLLKADNSAEPYAKCDASSDTTQCPSGTWCFGVTTGHARCLPLCNPTLATKELRDATCPGALPQSFVRLAHLAEGIGAADIHLNGAPLAEGLAFGELANNGDFLTLAIGTHTVSVHLDGVKVFEDNITLVGNEALNLVVVADPNSEEDVKIQILTVAEPRQAPTAVGDTTELRLVHGVADADVVDVIIVRAGESFDLVANHRRFANGLSFGQASSFVAVETDQDPEITEPLGYDVYVFPATERTLGNEIVLFEDVKVTTGDVATIYLIGTANSEDDQDLRLEFVAHSVAASARVLSGNCIDLLGGQQAPIQGLGICFENCTDNSHYGTGACSGGGANACNPGSPERQWCFPSGQSEVGGPCKETNECLDGLSCDTNGAGSGTCRSYCEPNAQVNAALSCTDDEICAPIRGFLNLGECRIGCEPGTNYTDASCPADQKACYATEGLAVCNGSGEVAVGANCGQPTVQNCVPGAMCAKTVPTFNGLLVEPFNELRQGETATCRPMCQAFKPAPSTTDCPANMACSPVMPGPTFSGGVGHCVESGPSRPANQSCARADVGKLCGDNAFCVDGGDGEGVCVRVCNFDTLAGCLGGEVCRAWEDDNSNQILPGWGRCGA